MEQTGKKTLVILTGPTAVGKTALSIGLAKAIGGEIISADSMQVYRGMDIGTAKISLEEMQGVPHYLIDELEPQQDFNVTVFQQKCKQYMEQIYHRGKIPVIVGGTGFYIQSVLYDIDFAEHRADGSVRRGLEETARKEGAQVLHDMLRKIDPAAAGRIHPHNVKRVIRAIEYYQQTGMSIAEHNEEQRRKTSPYRSFYFVLSLPREELYDRIGRRVDQMRLQGLEQEVRRLRRQGCTRDMVSMQGIGYRQILAALDGEMTMDEAFEQIKRDTRHFAKRQYTWFRRERDVIWLEKEKFADEQALLDHCVRKIV